jgi:hypothetical protein
MEKIDNLNAAVTEVDLARRKLDAFFREIASVISERRRRFKKYHDALMDRAAHPEADLNMGDVVMPDPDLMKILKNPTRDIL